ncbi:MAG: hypothetical protein ABIB47_02435 [Candidatus Woesearchaeota archaeon]
MKKTSKKDEIILAWTIFSMVFLALITFSAFLLPKSLQWLIYVVLILVLYLVYSRLVVPKMNWQHEWWSFKSRKLRLDKEEIIKIGDPEVSIIAFLIDGKYHRYNRIDRKNGFIISGERFKKGFLRYINIKVKYDGKELKVRIFRFSKEASKEMARLEEYLKSNR